MSEVGQITVKIGADTYELQKGIADAKTQLTGMERASGGVQSALNAVAAVAALAAGAIAVIAKNSIDSADNLNKMSQKVGVATEDLSKLAYAARLSDVDINALQQSFVFLSRGLSEANQGSGNALAGFNALGISIKNVDGTLKTSEQVLFEVADRFKSIEDGAQKTALAVAIFGRAGANMIPMLNQGSDGIREMGDELAKFGGVVTSQYAKAAEQFNDNLTRLNTILSGISMATFGPLIEGLNASFDAFVKTEKAVRGLATAFGSFSLSGKDVEEPTMALAKTEEAILKVKRTIEALNQYPVLNKDDLFIANQQLTYLEARSLALQNLFKQNATSTMGTEQAPQMVDAKAAETLQKQQQDLMAAQAARLETILQGNMSEIELEKMKYAELLTQLQISKEMFAVEEETYRQWELDSFNAHQQKLTELTRQEANKRIAEQQRESQMVNAARMQTASLAVGLLQTLGQKSKAAALAAIVLNKGLMIAQTIMNTQAASMRAMAELGPIAGPPAAAAIQAMGAASVGIIGATGLLEAGAAMSGGGGGGLGGGSTGATSVANTVRNAENTAQGAGGSSGTTVNIALQGNTFNRDQVRDLITQINEVISDGSTLRLS
jgi:hypothetical protein